ncbi:Putative E3 ubiquitin-protein ligase SH3RF1 [Chelonia mydas]|uniref:RING-type E3 ubiquitin transferase n=1 Tax=Chelonia mydas TaxID=8469 RepID=M7BL61_CHEMY|nr:Putative E3 ubiquitin-protein ligase SH3RF1 [Chelonia mydas]
MEISPPVLISSSNPTAAARISELTGLSCSAPSQVHISTTGLIVTPPPSSPVTTGPSFTFPSEVTYQAALGSCSALLWSKYEKHTPAPSQENNIFTQRLPSPGVIQRPASGSTDQTAHLRPQSRPSVYIAIYPYSPRKEDELELRKGEMFLVFERCQDGWFKGTSMYTSKIGVFPGNYVAPVTRTVTSALQAKVPMSTAGQTGRVMTMVSPSTAGGTSQKLQGNGLTVHSNVVPTAVVSAAHIQTSPQTKQLQPQLSNAAAYVTPVNINRSNVPLACAAASLNSSSITSASLDGDMSGRAVSVHPGAPASPENALAAGGNTAVSKPDKDNKKEKKGLLKLLSGASTKRKPRVSPPSSPTLEVEQAAAEMALQGAVGPEVPSAVSHGRAGSCPVDNEVSAAALAQETLHRKTSSLDSSIPIAPPPRQPCSSLGPVQNESRPVVCERYRVVVSYPPQSEAELELKEGDIVFVHKKREDGWFKGTLQRNGKTGLFPGSFVENI